MLGVAKIQYLQTEGDSYFERNLDANQKREASIGTKLFYDFICNQNRGGTPLMAKEF